ncbi:MAG: tRNA (adenosine(37)-N6)-threonylcarbamoyltransferase complex ATPase subunit type 1 TsaE [Parcubacteria group bacterium]
MMKATVVGLQGELGAGKTHFVKALGQMMGINERIVSPTFVIIKSYDMDWRGFKKLIHIDAYRLEKESELLNLGWNKLVENPENLILIEWPERVENILPKDAKRIFFKHEI